jgi:hypothetical protein
VSDSLLGIAMGAGVRFPAGVTDFSLLSCVQTESGATQPPIQCVPGAFSPVEKWHGREADHLPPSSASLGMVELYLHSPVRINGVVIN